MILSLILLYNSVPEFKPYHFKAFRLHEQLKKFDKCDVSEIEFFEILKAVKSKINQLDKHYTNSAKTNIDVYYIISSAMHVIEIQSHLYKSTLIAKQYYR